MEINKKDKIAIGAIVISLLIILFTFVFILREDGEEVAIDISKNIPAAKAPEYLYGICIDSLNVVTGEIGSGETLSVLLSKYGVSPSTIHSINQNAKGIFDLRNIKAGNNYTLFTTIDGSQTVKYLIYESSITEYVIFSLDDEIKIKKESKNVECKRKISSARIDGSLWNTMISNGMSSSLAMNLSDVFQWTIDFYGIQAGDEFKVIYDELYVDGQSIGAGEIYGAWFKHVGKEYYAVRFTYTENGKEESGYWDEDGKSLKSMFLKAPLKFSRISSKFSNSRMHPVLRIRRPHHGVDYAAPSGTPVQAIGNGTVISKGYSGGAGNMIKIKHAGGYVSGYMHLRGYAKGLRSGSSVSQGEVIGYVGSTGTSTGPHLDFRIWLNNKPINPLKLGTHKGIDIAKKYKSDFNIVKDMILAEMGGTAYSGPQPVNGISITSMFPDAP